MQPEPVIACLVAGHHVHRACQGRLGLIALACDQREQLLRVATGQAMQADLVGRGRVERDKPSRLAQFQGHEKCGRLLADGQPSNG